MSKMSSKQEIHSTIFEHSDSPQKRNKKQQEKNLRQIELINNYYINSTTQTWPESGTNIIPLYHNSF